MARGRWASLVVGTVVVGGGVAIGAAGCADKSPTAGLASAGSGGGGSGGGSGGSDVTTGSGGDLGTPTLGGRGGSGGGAVAGAGGGQPPGCQPPAATAGVWTELEPPPGQSGFRATDAFALGTDDLMFAGAVLDAGGVATESRVLRWTRGCWTTEVTIPASAVPVIKPSVYGLGPDDVWATAGDLIYHRDAQGWTRFADEGWRVLVRPPPSFEGAITIVRVRAAAPTSVWFAATSNILRWDGLSWTTFSFDDPTYPNESATIGFGYNDIWTDGANDVWVAGGSDVVGLTMDLGYVHHFSAGVWTRTAIGLSSVYAIRRAGPVLWLANPTQADLNGQLQVLTLRRFDGVNAPVAPIMGVDPAGPRPLMTSLWGMGGATVWAAGTDVAHFDGQTWSLVPDAPAAARGSTDQSNTLVTGDGASVWLATPGPRFFRQLTGP